VKIVLCAATVLLWGCFLLYLFFLSPGIKYQICEESQIKPKYHPKQVRLSEEFIVRQIKTITVGNRPVWITLSAVVVDKHGYVWLNGEEWAYPKKESGLWIKADPVVSGYTLTMPPNFLGTPKTQEYKKGYIPVLKITYEE
jgi:hypothetical protein